MATIKTHATKQRPGAHWRERGPAAGADLRDISLIASIVEYSEDAIVCFSLDGIVRSWNPGAQRLFGYDGSEIIGKSIALIAPDDRLGESQAMLATVASGRSVRSLETIRRRKDGSTVDVEITLSPIMEGSRPVAIAGLLKDITLRRESEERLAHQAGLLDNVSDAIISTDLNFRITDWNRAAELTFGWTAAQVAGREVDELLGTEYLGTTKARAVRDLMAAGSSSVEVILRDQCRNTLTFHRDATLMRDHAGRPTAIVLILRDLTERRQTERELLESGARLRAIFNQAAAGIVQADLSGRVLFANPRFCDTLGWTQEELQQKTVQEITHPDDVARTVAQFQRAIEARECTGIEKRCLRKDGPAVWFTCSISPIMDASGKPKSVILVLVDITLRKQAEEALTAGERQISAIYANVSGIIFCLDVMPGGNFRFASVNQQFLRATGLPEAQVIGKFAQEIIPAESAAFVLQRYREAVRTRTVVRWEEVSIYPAGEKHGEVSVTPIIDENGAVIQLIGIMHDITALKHAAAELGRLNAGLESRVAARTAELSSANASLRKAVADRRRLENEILEISESERGRIGRDLHDDLGQQLAGIGWLASALQKQIPADSPEWKGRATRIAELANNALALAKSLARGLHPVPSERGGLMTALHELAAHSSGLFHVHCRFTCPRPVTLGDPNAATHLYRIAQEAVTNAVRHGKARNIQISLAGAGGKITLTITDDGQAAKEMKEKREGLGMRIMHYRAETLGGSLKFTREPGAGARITCQIPIPADAARKPRKAAPSKLCARKP